MLALQLWSDKAYNYEDNNEMEARDGDKHEALA